MSHGLEHWGSDQMGVNKTRRFLLEWLSFTCRYIPVGILEVLPQRINERPLPYVRRVIYIQNQIRIIDGDLESASDSDIGLDSQLFLFRFRFRILFRILFRFQIQIQSRIHNSIQISDSDFRFQIQIQSRFTIRFRCIYLSIYLHSAQTNKQTL